MLSWSDPIKKAILLAGLILVLYFQVVHHEFINLDDWQYVVDNPDIRSGLSLRGLRWAFTSLHASNWHPLTWLSHMVDCEIYGLNAGGHHMTSLLFHVLNTVLLFLVLARMTGAPGRSGIVAALFALHPLHVESVAWVAERKDVLSTFFLILTLGSYTLYLEKPERWKYGTTVGLYALGLMAKPMLVSLPLLLLLLDYWPLRGGAVPERPLPEAESTGGREGKGGRPPVVSPKKRAFPAKKTNSLVRAPERRDLRHRIVEKAPFFVLALASSVITLYAQASGGAMRTLDAIPPAERMANALVSCIAYIGKMFWPSHLSVFYPYPAAIPLWKPLGAAALILLVTYFVLRERTRRPWFFTGWFWYLITLFPVIGIVQVGPQSMADRYTYVPLIGLFIAVTWGMGELFTRRRVPAVLRSLVVLAVLAGLSIVTWYQAAHWKNSRTLFEQALKATENNALAHNNLAVALAGERDRARAMAHYREALRIKPNHYGAHFNLANHLSALGETGEAISHYNEAIRLKPDYTAAHNNLGLLLFRRGNLEEAEGHFLEAVKYGPVKAGMIYNLAMISVARGEGEKGIRFLREALRMKPDYGEAHNLLGIVYSGQGKEKEAADCFRNALSCDPRFDAARLNLENLEKEKK